MVDPVHWSFLEFSGSLQTLAVVELVVWLSETRHGCALPRQEAMLLAEEWAAFPKLVAATLQGTVEHFWLW